MPYIEKIARQKIDDELLDLIDKLTEHGFHQPSVGELNYVISSLIWKVFDNNVSYTTANNLIGVLECVKQEFIRRKLNIYEDEKIKLNGDL